MKAAEHFLNGNACSESIILGAIDKGWCDKSLLPMATAFGGGVASGCICGAVSGSVMVISHIYGKENQYNNPPIARQLAKKFMDDFKEVHKATCCRILSRGTDAGTPERKQHCSNFVEFCFNNLEKLLTETEASLTNG